MIVELRAETRPIAQKQGPNEAYVERRDISYKEERHGEILRMFAASVNLYYVSDKEGARKSNRK